MSQLNVSALTKCQQRCDEERRVMALLHTAAPTTAAHHIFDAAIAVWYDPRDRVLAEVGAQLAARGIAQQCAQCHERAPPVSARCEWCRRRRTQCLQRRKQPPNAVQRKQHERPAPCRRARSCVHQTRATRLHSSHVNVLNWLAISARLHQPARRQRALGQPSITNEKYKQGTIRDN
jgi:hypothetical protein